MAAIKNIIFDLGGVLLQIDYNKTRESFIALGIENFDDLYRQDFVSEIFEELEVGKISEIEFYQRLNNITSKNLSFEQIKRAWNAMLGSFWKERLDYLITLKTNYNLFLFSNTNEIHFNAFRNIYNKEMNNQNLDDYFIEVYYSHQMGLRKPDKDSFIKIINEQKLIIEETLFIDDTLKNIKGAIQVGLKAIHLSSNMDFISTIKNCLLVKK